MKKQTRYLSAYKNFELLHKLEKKRSKTAVQFMTDDPEDSFVDVVYFNKKNEKVTDSYVILTKEVPDRINNLKKDGYEEV